MKEALFFSPYLDTMGGGEVYMLQFAKSIETTHKIVLAWDDSSVMDLAQKRLGIEFTNFSFDTRLAQLLKHSGNIQLKLALMRKYDLFFFVSDGSIPWMFARKNLLHMQVPFTTVTGNIGNRLKLISVSEVVCNSKFTKSVIDRQLGVNSQVLYPPVTATAKPGKKENTILSVARFSKSQTVKRQDILVQAFKQLVDSGVSDWKLVLLGSTHLKEDQEFVAHLKKSSQGYPIEFLVNASFDELNKAYSTAKIFWHAAGYGIDETKQPEKVEHFGISTVEAMTAGCVPVVINKGGQKEIVEHEKSGYLFNTTDELVEYTKQLIANPKQIIGYSQAAQKRASVFSIESFRKHVRLMVV